MAEITESLNHIDGRYDLEARFEVSTDSGLRIGCSLTIEDECEFSKCREIAAEIIGAELQKRGIAWTDPEALPNG